MKLWLGIGLGISLGWYLRGLRAKKSIENLKSLEELRKEFVSTVSHELRTPLTSIGGFVKLIAAGDAGPINETQTEFLDIIDKNVERLTHLINDILDVEKIESGKFQMVRGSQNLREILLECVENVQVLSKKKAISLVAHIPDQALWMEGDRIRLMQIFENLLSNSIKYTQKGSVTLEVERYELAVVVRVRDTGIGISEGDLERIFQKFYRTEASMTLAEGGTGLGLTIVQALVNAHSGRITVESEVGKGSVFSVTFPLDSEKMKESTREGNFFRQKERERPVWLVGFSAPMRDVVSELLKGLGLSVSSSGIPFREFTFERVFDSDELISSEQPSVVILAVPADRGQISSRLSGLQQSFRENVPVILLGGQSDAGLLTQPGVFAILEDPLDLDRLQSLLAELVNRRDKRILLANSNPDLRLLLKRGLERNGFEVDDLDYGNLVLMKIEQVQYDLLIIDHPMNDISGIELAKHIQKNHPTKRFPIVITSNETEVSVPKGIVFIPSFRGLDVTIQQVTDLVSNLSEDVRR